MATQLTSSTASTRAAIRRSGTTVGDPVRELAPPRGTVSSKPKAALKPPAERRRGSTSGSAGMSAAAVPAADPPASADGWYVDISGLRGTATVVAPDGSSDAPVADPGFRPDVPGVTHISEGDSGELVVAPFTGVDPYKVRFTAGNDPLMLDLRRGQQEAPDAMTRWNDVAVPPNSEFTLTLGADGAPSLIYTDPATGTSTPVEATASVTGVTARYGYQAPTVAVGAILLGGTKQYTLTATPSVAAVTRILWSVDGQSFHLYDGPIGLDPSISRLTVFADAAAGNRSAPQDLDLGSAPLSPVTTATTSPALPANGFASGPVTVRLHARATDGTTTSVTYSVSAPSKGTKVTNVAGDTATFTLSTDESYTVRYHASDSAGHVEKEHFLSIGIDSTRPPSPSPRLRQVPPPTSWVR